MVLSNKKLKQKIREAVAESLTVAETAPVGPDSSRKQPKDLEPTNPELKVLLDASRQRPKLSKRESRRKAQALLGLDSDEKSTSAKKSEEPRKSEDGSKSAEGDGKNGVERKKEKNKKRKRDEEGKTSTEGKSNGAEVTKKAKKNKKMKKKNKIKSKKKEMGNGGVEAKEEATVVPKKEAAVVIESQPIEDTSTKVYVGGIPYYSTEDDIRSYFESCGTITEIDCMYFPDTGKFRGIAMISFKTESATKRALALDGSDMGGFFLKIQPYKATKVKKVPDFEPKIVAGYNRIYVGNLSWDTKEDDLKTFFSDCNISSIRLGKDKETQKFRGFAHVDFSDDVSLMMALKLDQEIFYGRPVKISCAVPRREGKSPSAAVNPSEESNNEGLKPASGGASNDGFHSTPASDGADNDWWNSIPASDEANNDWSNSMPVSDGANNDGSIPVSGKIKRRKCYLCGEKGHISSACPNEKPADPTNSKPN